MIESNFAQLEARIAAAQDFSEVERAHANYLHALMQQSFLNTTTICRTISALFQWVPGGEGGGGCAAAVPSHCVLGKGRLWCRSCAPAVTVVRS